MMKLETLLRNSSPAVHNFTFLKPWLTWILSTYNFRIDSTEKLIQSWESLGHLIENPEMEKNVYKFAYDYTRVSI